MSTKDSKLYYNMYKNNHKRINENRYNGYHRQYIICQVYKPKNKSPNIDNHVYISKQTTQYLSEYIVKENWGKNNILLYKYLDYIWRLQIINKMVKKFYFRNEGRLVFHSGLYSRKTNEEVYMCLVPNDINPNKHKHNQKWRVTLGDLDFRYSSIMTKKEIFLLHKLRENDLPKKIEFNEDKIQFNPTYPLQMKLFECIRTGKDRILKVFKYNGIDINMSLHELKNLIENGIKQSINIARNYPHICGKQIFIERDLINNKKLTKGYHIELLLPLTLTINNEKSYFAVALRENKHLNRYEIMSIITREMGYANSRLISYVNINWLKPFVNTNKLDNIPSLSLDNLTDFYFFGDIFF